MAPEAVLPWLLRVQDDDPGTRLRAVNALVLIYGMIGAGLVGVLPLAFIPGGPVIAGIVLATVAVFAAAAVLLRSGRVTAGLVLFFAVFLGAFAAVPLVGQDARLSAVYCCLPVVVACVTLRRGGVALVTAAALAIAVTGTWAYPPVDPPPTTFEVITAGVLLIVICLVSGLLGMWGRRQETRRADDAARRAGDLAATLARANTELEQRVEERTEALQRALSQQETLVAELADLSLRDPLTGLYNRRHAEHELPRLVAASDRYGTPLALALVDLDHFKRINDTWSYSIGDEVLLRFTRILRETARGTDLVTRYGGEEFLLIMPQTTADQAAVLCERLRTAVEAQTWDDVARGLHLTVSVGIADTEGREGIVALAAAADAAVHAAKRNGRNRIELAPSVPADEAAVEGS